MTGFFKMFAWMTVVFTCLLVSSMIVLTVLAYIRHQQATDVIEDREWYAGATDRLPADPAERKTVLGQIRMTEGEAQKRIEFHRLMDQSDALLDRHRDLKSRMDKTAEWIRLGLIPISQADAETHELEEELRILSEERAEVERGLRRYINRQPIR